VSASTAFLQEVEGPSRVCASFPGVRLDNGGGSSSAVLGLAGPQECVETCRRLSNCSQLVYSAGNKGCYMFEHAKAERYAKDDGSDLAQITSAFCTDGGSSSFRLEGLRAQLGQSTARQERAEVQRRWREAEQKASALIATMTQDAKLTFVRGAPGGLGYAGFLKPAGLPPSVMPLKMQDGPQGFNPYQVKLAGTATQFPSLLSVAASFDPQVAEEYAQAVADEFVTKGANVLLGPDVEVTRATLTGRCFETISGEDPFLGSQLVGPFVKAIQARGIIATVKHWLDNNQEIYRQTMTSVVAERTQHEVYMPVFKAAFEAGAGAVMCAYNKVNGHHACENGHILTKLLREDLGFKGYVVSDWGATHNGERSANSGLDVEMPSSKYFANLTDYIAAGSVKQEKLDQMVTHVLSAMYFVGGMDGVFPAEKAGAWGHLPATTDGHRATALKTVLDSAVLLKNHDTLPLLPSTKKIALIGGYCKHSNDKRFAQGSVYSSGGSGFVMTTRTITPLEGLQEHYQADPSVEIVHSTDTSAAAGADVAVICAAAHSEEGWDRQNLSLPEAGRLAKALRDENGEGLKIVVMASVPGAITTEWIDDIDAALLLFGPGEQVGAALAQLLAGDASPGGRLPVSLPKVGEERFTKWQYPGLCKDNSWCKHMIANFSEGTLVGYKWNIAKNVPSAFPFGYGLTYTNFEFKDLKVECDSGVATVAFKVANVGVRKGVAVPQAYVGFESLKPVVRQLRGFRKVELAAGHTADVAMVLDEKDWSFFDEDKDRWVSALEVGDNITVSVGSSSVDLPLASTFSCKLATALVK